VNAAHIGVTGEGWDLTLLGHVQVFLEVCSREAGTAGNNVRVAERIEFGALQRKARDAGNALLRSIG